jgi:hypothetical protein
MNPCLLALFTTLFVCTIIDTQGISQLIIVSTVELLILVFKTLPRFLAFLLYFVALAIISNNREEMVEWLERL